MANMLFLAYQGKNAISIDVLKKLRKAFIGNNSFTLNINKINICIYEAILNSKNGFILLYNFSLFYKYMG